MSDKSHRIKDPAVRSRKSGLAVERAVEKVVDRQGWQQADPATQPYVVADFMEAYSNVRAPALGVGSSVEGLWWSPKEERLMHVECVGTFERSTQPGLRRSCSAMKVAGRLIIPWLVAQSAEVEPPAPVLFTTHLPLKGSLSAQTLAVIANAAELRVGLVGKYGLKAWLGPQELIELSAPPEKPATLFDFLG